MPHRPAPRRSFPISLNALQLTGSIALGMWLGFIAIVLTCWLASRLLFSEQLAPVVAAVEQLAKPPVVVQPIPDIPSQSPLFEQYEENLRKNEQQQRLVQARSSSCGAIGQATGGDSTGAGHPATEPAVRAV